MKFKMTVVLSLMIFVSTVSISGKLDGSDSLFCSDPQLADCVKKLISQGIKDIDQAPAQTISVSDGDYKSLIKRVDPESSSFNQALTKLTDGSKNALTDLSLGKNRIQAFIDHYKYLYTQEVNRCGYDPKDFGIDLDITEGINPQPTSLEETHESLLGLMRNFFLKRKSLFSESAGNAINTELGSFLYFTLGWDFSFKNNEDEKVFFNLATEYASFYTLLGYAGDPEKDLVTVSDLVNLCFHRSVYPVFATESSYQKALWKKFFALTEKKERQLRERFFRTRIELENQKKRFFASSEMDRKNIIETLKAACGD